MPHGVELSSAAASRVPGRSSRERTSSAMIVDLSAPLYDGMRVYEGDPPVAISQVRTRQSDGWELRHLSMGSHTGTHVDAPVHMHDGGATLDELPLSRFCGPAEAVRVGTRPYPRLVGLLFSEPVPDGEVPHIVDAGAPFVGGPLEESTERDLLGRGVVTYTDLVNVDVLPVGRPFQFFGFPLRIRSGDGSPVRAVAILEA